MVRGVEVGVSAYARLRWRIPAVRTLLVALLLAVRGLPIS